ncbi:UNVERIFIED_CONTAM: hypothetical protein FKN15_042305 [Acipenser sinensis]
MNTRCPPKHVPSAARFFTLCRLTVQPPQSYSVGGQRSSGQLTCKSAGARPDYRGRWCVKMQDECQDRRSCQLLVNSRLFGVDPCPSTSKYLTVWYKCRPNEYKSKVACEDDKLTLSCKQSMVIAIYSAIFGWSLKGSLECPYQNTGVPAVGKTPSISKGLCRLSSWVELTAAGESNHQEKVLKPNLAQDNWKLLEADVGQRLIFPLEIATTNLRRDIGSSCWDARTTVKPS